MGHLEGEASAPLCERGRGAYYETGARTRRSRGDSSVALRSVRNSTPRSTTVCGAVLLFDGGRESGLCSGAHEKCLATCARASPSVARFPTAVSKFCRDTSNYSQHAGGIDQVGNNVACARSVDPGRNETNKTMIATLVYVNVDENRTNSFKLFEIFEIVRIR